MRKKSLFVLFLMLNACQAYVDSSREAGIPHPVGRSTPDRVAICYHPWKTSQDELLQMAADECAKTDRKPVFSHKENMECRLLTPQVAYFDCRK